MFQWIFNLFRHEHEFQVIGAVEASTESGVNTSYAVAVCMHPLCAEKAYFPSENRKIHQNWLKQGKKVHVKVG